MQAEEDPVDANVPTVMPHGNHRDQLRARRVKLPRLRFAVGRRAQQRQDNGQSVARWHLLPHPLRRAARRRTAAKFRATDTATYRRQAVRLSPTTCPRVAQYDPEDRSLARSLRLQPAQSCRRKPTAAGTIRVLAQKADRSSSRSPIAAFDGVRGLRSKAEIDRINGPEFRAGLTPSYAPRPARLQAARLRACNRYRRSFGHFLR